MADSNYVICDENDLTNIADAIRDSDGSTETMSVSEMPTKIRNISGSGTDISLGVTGATVGQSVQVTSVDANGKPTAWAAVTAGTPTDTQVETAINNFLTEHPVAAGATEEQANQIIQNKQDIALLTQDFNEYSETAIIAVDPVETQEVIDTVEAIKTEIRNVGNEVKNSVDLFNRVSVLEEEIQKIKQALSMQ